MDVTGHGSVVSTNHHCVVYFKKVHSTKLYGDIQFWVLIAHGHVPGRGPIHLHYIEIMITISIIWV